MQIIKSTRFKKRRFIYEWDKPPVIIYYSKYMYKYLPLK